MFRTINQSDFHYFSWELKLRKGFYGHSNSLLIFLQLEQKIGDFVIKNTKEDGGRIPSKKIENCFFCYLNKLGNPLVSFSLLTRFRLSFGEAMAPLSMGST